MFDLADGRSDSPVASLTDQTGREITKRSHDAGPGAGPDPGAVLTKRDVTHLLWGSALSCTRRARRISR